ncbi:glycosyltransferase family 2 protein [Pectobacterium versatile]|uniref:glycosyltransferase family 2 protein n=1 Tax=Pectobacterium versatile TaxID=2488639 RepID=UPI001B37E870|nr:glycosyltransferase family 2 protein [Pectobacterium versatile]
MITAVYVTFNPNLELLRESIDSIDTQINKIIIVDNSDTSNISSFTHLYENIELISIGNNIGIAAAQNIGINRAISLGADYILLSDQDTIYPKEFVKRMLPVFSLYQNVAAVVPKFIDFHKNKEDGFITKNLCFFKQVYFDKGTHEVFHAIASGKIISCKVIKEIGGFDSNLFIDWVDFQWCWKARKKGFKIIANADVLIKHRLGDSSKNIFVKDINIRAPIRHYYITRNAFYLALRTEYLDIPHRLILFLKSFRYVIGYPLFLKPRLKNLRYVIIGMYHGIIGKIGKADFYE